MNLFQFAADNARKEYAMRRWLPDPLTEDDEVIAARAEEDAREIRWAEFVLECSRWGHARMAACIADLYRWQTKGMLVHMALDAPETLVRDFVETEGFAGAFSALARAIKEQDA